MQQIRRNLLSAIVEFQENDEILNLTSGKNDEMWVFGKARDTYFVFPHQVFCRNATKN
jgi:hypothetical protein